MQEWTGCGRRVKLVKGNIAMLDVEAVVNAANKSLVLGGGVAGAIKRFGGSTIQEECNSIGPIKVGEAAITGGGKLKAKYVIHAVGPVYGEGDEDKKLSMAALNSLRIARQQKIRDIAFPAISAGIFGFPVERCSRIMLQTVMDFLKENDYPQEVVFCLFDDEVFTVFSRTLDDLS